MGSKLVIPLIFFALIFKVLSFPFEIRVSLSDNKEVLNNIQEITVSCKDDLFLNGENLGNVDLKVYIVKDEIHIEWIDKKGILIKRGIFERIECSKDPIIINSKKGIYKFPGAIEIYPRMGKLFIVNELDIEKYVELVLPYEMGKDASIEALKAQAVLARTYALKKMESSVYSRYGYDICSSSICQVYKGIPQSDLRKYRIASEETAGMTLKYGNNLASIFFSSHNGGRTAKTSEIWKKDIPYIMAFEDRDEKGIPFGAFSDHYSWVVSIPRIEILWKLSSRKTTFIGAKLKRIEILERGVSKRVKKIRIVGEKEIILNGYTFRSILGLKSSLFDIQYDPINDCYIFWGGGFGHGVGLSQYGAMDMARKGYEYDEILDHYFPGTILSGSIEVIIDDYNDISGNISVEIDGKLWKMKKNIELIPNISPGVKKVSLKISNVEIQSKEVIVFSGKKSKAHFKVSRMKYLPVLHAKKTSKKIVLIPHFELNYKNKMDGVLIKITFDHPVDSVKLVLKRKSTIDNEWFKLFERKLENAKSADFFDYTVNLSGIYNYKILISSMDDRDLYDLYFFTVLRNFKILVMKEKISPNLPMIRMPDLDEDKIMLKSLIFGDLPFVDLRTLNETFVYVDGRRMTLRKGGIYRFGVKDGKITLLDKDVELAEKIKIKGLFEIEKMILNDVILIIKNGKFIILKIETLSDYLTRNTCLFVEKDDSPKMRELKTIILRAHVVHSLLTGRYAGEDYDLPYILDGNFKVKDHTVDITEAKNYVEKTKNIVITVCGMIVDGLFNLSNAGIKAKDERRWYLKGGKDKFSTLTKWEKTYRSEEIGKTLSKICDIGKIEKIEILSKDKYGRIVKLRFTGERGVKILIGKNMEEILNLPSSIFQIRKSGDKFVFYGKGIGNFLGISLESARKMLENGKSLEGVVNEYFIMAKLLPFKGRSCLERVEMSKSVKELMSLIPEYKTFGDVKVIKKDEGRVILKYKLTDEKTAGIFFNIPIVNERIIPKILIKGDDSNNFLRYELIDSDGESFISPIMKLNDIQEIELSSSSLESMRLKNWGNCMKKNGKVDFPFILKSVYVAKSEYGKDFGYMEIEF